MLLPVCRSWPCAVTSGCNQSPGSAAGFIARSGYSRGGGAFQIAMDLQERAEEIDRENPVPTPTEPRSRLKRSSGGGSGVGDQGLVNRSARRRVALAVKLFPKTFLSHGNEALLACPGRPRDRRVAAVSTPGKLSSNCATLGADECSLSFKGRTVGCWLSRLLSFRFLSRSRAW